MKFHRSAWFIPTLLLALPSFAQPAQPLPAAVSPAAAGFSAERLERLHHMIDRTVDDGSHAGYILLLARDGKIVDWRAHGFADVATKLPLQRDSIVRIMSMTKLLTSTAALILVEEGKLKLTDRADQYFPSLRNLKVFTGGSADAPLLEDAKTPITIHQLLTHTSGLFYGFDLPPALGTLQNRAAIWSAPNMDEFVARVATVPLSAQPGTEFRYGISTDLLGMIIEKVSGQTLDDFFQTRICGPLGIADTDFCVPAGKRARLARIHIRDSAGRLIPKPNQEPPIARRSDIAQGLSSGGGGLYSTAGDYARFAQMLLNGGQLDGTRILGRKAVELMTQNHIANLADPHPVGAKSQGFGLGVRLLTDLGACPTLGSVGSFGWDGAATTTVQIDPRERVVALLLYQHEPMNEGEVFALFTNGWYAALEN